MENQLISALIAIIGLLAAGLGTLALFQVSSMQKSRDLDRRSQETDSRDQWKAIAELNKLTGDMREKAADSRAELEQQLANFRTHVAENYARNSRLDGLETRIFEKLESIDRKLDTKMDKEAGRG